MASLPEFIAGLLIELPKRAIGKTFSLLHAARLALFLLLATALALGFLLLLFAPPYLTPPKYSAFNEGWDGTSLFYSLSGARGQAKAAYGSLSELAALGRGATLVVISPDREYTAGERQEIREFVARGGTLIISDARGPGSRLAKEFAVSYSNSTVADFLSFTKRQDFPAIPYSVSGDSGFFLAKFPSALLNYPEDSLILASTSPESYVDYNANMVIDTGDLKGPFPAAIAAPFAEGLVVAVSDADAFTNDLILRADNAAFADAILSNYASGLVIFDETHRIGERDPVLYALLSFSDKARDPGFIALIAAAAAIAVLASFLAWSSTERKAVEGKRDLKSHNYRDLVNDIHSNARTRAEPYTWIVLMQYDRFREKLLKSIDPFGKELSNKELAKKAAAKNGWDREDLEGLLERLESIKSGESAVRSIEESTALCRIMDGYLEKKPSS